MGRAISLLVGCSPRSRKADLDAMHHRAVFLKKWLLLPEPSLLVLTPLGFFRLSRGSRDVSNGSLGHVESPHSEGRVYSQSGWYVGVSPGSCSSYNWVDCILLPTCGARSSGATVGPLAAGSSCTGTANINKGIQGGKSAQQ